MTKKLTHADWEAAKALRDRAAMSAVRLLLSSRQDGLGEDRGDLLEAAVTAAEVAQSHDARMVEIETELA